MNKLAEEKDIEEIIKTKLNETYQNGLATGCKAMCKVILDKLQNKNKSVPERLNDVIKFCNVSLGEENNESKK